MPLYPFTAIVGQEDVKACLLYCLVNPRVGGVLISGECGAGKTTLVRGLADLVKDMRIVELPLGATEDRLLGTLDVGAAITRGEKRFEPGLLKSADGNILYVDEINLLAAHMANTLLEAASGGVARIEREGISGAYDSRFILIGQDLNRGNRNRTKNTIRRNPDMPSTMVLITDGRATFSDIPGIYVALPRQNAHLPYKNSAFVSVASLDSEVFGGCQIIIPAAFAAFTNSLSSEARGRFSLTAISK